MLRRPPGPAPERPLDEDLARALGLLRSGPTCCSEELRKVGRRRCSGDVLAAVASAVAAGGPGVGGGRRRTTPPGGPGRCGPRKAASLSGGRANGSTGAARRTGGVGRRPEHAAVLRVAPVDVGAASPGTTLARQGRPDGRARPAPPSRPTSARGLVWPPTLTTRGRGQPLFLRGAGVALLPRPLA